MDGQRLDILLVEDNPGQARLVGETLADGGLAEYALNWAPTLGEALGRLETGGFDVALVDLTLPDSDGLDTVRRIRARAPRLPMVVLTGLEGGATGLEALQAGAQDYLTKGRLEGDLLVRSIRYAIERSAILGRLEEAQREQLRMKDHLLDHVAHELRAPLTAIYYSVRNLRDGLADDASTEQREQLEVALKNVDQLRAMVGDLVDAARAGSGRLTLRPAANDVAPLIAEAVRSHGPTADAKGIALSADVPPHLPPACVDAQRVRQILDNLLDNALKFTPVGGSITVRATLAEPETACLCITVVDTGCGIPTEVQEHIFERLYQAHGSFDGRTGLGLGLYLCRELVQRHGGRLWVGSRVGEGSEFSFTLPLFSLERVLSLAITEGIRDPERLALVAVHITRQDPLAPLAAAGEALGEARAILRSIAPPRSVLLPDLAGTEAAGLTVLLADLGGAEVDQLAAQIRQELGSPKVSKRIPLASARVFARAVSPPAAREPQERLASHVASVIRTLVGAGADPPTRPEAI